MKRILCVFLKYPEPGCVKTRLAESLGDSGAAEVYRRMVCEVLLKAREAGPDRICICFSPEEKERQIKDWLDPWIRDFPGEVTFAAQADGDLGNRLQKAAEDIFVKDPDSAVLIIGTDCLEIDRLSLQTAWQALENEQTDVVLGPAKDGGYYLMGLCEPVPALFDDISWSTAQVFQQTLERAAARHKQCLVLEEKTDIDTIGEYRQFEDRLRLRPCVFFDRDGVVNESPGEGYVLKKEDFHLSEGIVESLQTAREKGYLTVVVTSQKGVGKKLMSPADLNHIHYNLQKDLAKDHVAFDAIYSFTGTPDCIYKAKPDPAMIFAAAKELPIDLSRSWLVGDADRDIAMGRNAELRGTIRINGDKPVSIDADHTLQAVFELPKLLRKVL